MDYTIVNCKTMGVHYATRSEARFYLDVLSADYIVYGPNLTMLIPGEL